jgi:hypothetical protein
MKRRSIATPTPKHRRAHHTRYGSRSIHAWYGRQRLAGSGYGKLTYNIEDPRYPLLTEGAGVDKQAEIDPTQRLATSEGRSPAPILGSTFSDELALSNAGRSKIFAVSVKDRGAIPMAGHAGKAFWFSKSTGGFVSSTYYHKEYPSWAKDWNAKRVASSYAGSHGI